MSRADAIGLEAIADRGGYSSTTPEYALWLAALRLYVEDVIHYHKTGRAQVGDCVLGTAAAYADLHGNCSQLARLCKMLECDTGTVRKYLLERLNSE
jgi:hypothetical protein